MKQFKLWASIWLTLIISFTASSQTVSVTGTSQKWHKLTVSLTLPGSVLTENNNTFRNSRMDVVFTRPDGSTLRVPGFFAADGNAANTNATEGNVFKAYLRPDQLGAWSYQVLYYTGTDVATNAIGSLPPPVYNLTGTVGTIVASNKTLPDLRAKGKLQYQKTGTNNQRRYLRFAETGEYFLKFGPDSPENFLDYNDFDFADTRNNCSLCVQHSYSPHSGDFNTGDPTWDGGKGENIIGAINYMSEIGQVNSISMSLYGGDDKNVFPWTKVNSKFIYDVSKLEQWEIVLNHAEQKGLHLHFKLAEAENWFALNTIEINTYYREMVARFGHHLGVEWNISEEYGSRSANGTAASATPKINFLDAVDPWDNLIVIHTRPESEFKQKYDDFLAQNPKTKLTGASMQNERNSGNYPEVFTLTKDLIVKSRNNNTPWVVASDEQATANNGVFNNNSETNSSVSQSARKYVLWGNLMAGGAGVMWYGGSRGDFRTEDFRRYVILDRWGRHAIRTFFLGSGVEFWNTDNNDNLISGAGNRCLANAGQAYIIYLPNGGSTNLNLSGQSGNFDVKWFDPRNGGVLQNGSVTSVSGGASRNLGNAPNNTTSDWAILVTAQTGTDPVTGVTVAPTTLSLVQSQTSTLTATVLPSTAANKSVIWSSNNTSVATVSTSGVVTAVSVGTATITVTTVDGSFTATCAVTVTAPSGNITIGNATDTNAGIDGWKSNLVINKSETYTNTTGSSQTLNINEFVFYANREADPVTPFIVKVNSDNDFTILAVGTSRSSTAYNVGENTLNFNTGTTKQITLANGETIAPGFLDANANGAGGSIGSVIPFDQTSPADEIWYTGGPASGNSASVVEGTAPTAGLNTLTTLSRNYRFKINLSVATSSSQTVTLPVINDAYLQGTTNFNNNVLKIQQIGTVRVGYLMFDLSGVNGTITSAELKMTCNGDGSSSAMNIKVDKGNSSNWNESNLSSSNKPSATDALGNINGSWSIGTRYTWVLDETKLSGGGNLSLILSSTSGGSDAWFASDENSVTGPELVVTYNTSVAKQIQASKPKVSNIAANEQSFIAMYPNPLYNQDLKINLAKDVDSHVRIFGIQGQLINESKQVRNQLILSNRLFNSKGMYFVHVQSGDINKIMKLIVR